MNEVSCFSTYDGIQDDTHLADPSKIDFNALPPKPTSSGSQTTGRPSGITVAMRLVMTFDSFSFLKFAGLPV